MINTRPVENSLMDYVCDSDFYKKIFMIGLLNDGYDYRVRLKNLGSYFFRVITAPFILAVALLDIPFWAGKTVVFLCLGKLTKTHFKNFPRHLLTIVFLFPLFVGYVPIGMRGKRDQKIRAVIEKFKNKGYGDLSIEEENKRRTFHFLHGLEYWYYPCPKSRYNRKADYFYSIIKQLLIDTNYSKKPDANHGSGLMGSTEANQLIKDLLDARYPNHSLPWEIANSLINLIVGNCVVLAKPYSGPLRSPEKEEAGIKLTEDTIAQQIDLLEIVFTATGKRNEYRWPELEDPDWYREHGFSIKFFSRETRSHYLLLLMGLLERGGMQEKPNLPLSFVPDGRICKNGEEPFANEDNIFTQLLKKLILTGRELKQFEEYVVLLKRFLNEFPENAVQQQELIEKATKANMIPIDYLVKQMRAWFVARNDNPYIWLLAQHHLFINGGATVPLLKGFYMKCGYLKRRAENILKLKEYLLKDSEYHKEMVSKLLAACPQLEVGKTFDNNFPFADMIFAYAME